MYKTIIKQLHMTPVTLSEAKLSSRVRSGDRENGLIETWVAAATRYVANLARVVIVPSIVAEDFMLPKRTPVVYGGSTNRDSHNTANGIRMGEDCLSVLAILHEDGTFVTDWSFDARTKRIKWGKGVPASDGRFLTVYSVCGFDSAYAGQLACQSQDALDTFIEEFSVVGGGSGVPVCATPSDLKSAIMLITNDLYELRGDVQGISPKRVNQLIARYRKPIFRG